MLLPLARAAVLRMAHGARGSTIGQEWGCWASGGPSGKGALRVRHAHEKTCLCAPRAETGFFCFLQAVLLLQKPRERLYPTEPLVLWGSGVGRPWVGPGQLLEGEGENGRRAIGRARPFQDHPSPQILTMQKHGAMPKR